MIYPVVRDLAAQGSPVAVCWRLLGVPTSGFYEWRARRPSARKRVDAELTVSIAETRQASRGTYGVPRVHAELGLGLGVRIGRKRVARLMHASTWRFLFDHGGRPRTAISPLAGPGHTVYARPDAGHFAAILEGLMRNRGCGPRELPFMGVSLSTSYGSMLTYDRRDVYRWFRLGRVGACATAPVPGPAQLPSVTARRTSSA
jgi:hypothetical protein